MEYKVYTTDTTRNLTGGDLSDGEWREIEEAGSPDRRKAESYAVYKAADAAFFTACALMREQGIANTPYSGVDRPIVDDGRIEAMIQTVRDAMAARAAKLARQPAPLQYLCAGAKDGCRTRVYAQGQYCAKCDHDEI